MARDRRKRAQLTGRRVDVDRLQVNDVVPIAGMLAAFGLTGEGAALGRIVLEEQGLTRCGKTNIAPEKMERARAAIDEQIARFCSSCAEAEADGRALIVVPAEACAYCAGSNNQRALLEMLERCDRASVERLVVVGGSPSVRADFGRAGARVELRLVNGIERRTKPQARGDIDWADVVVVCGASELYHGVSAHYTRDPQARTKLAVSARRGVEAIASAVSEHLELREG
jgi:hypothetical protein